MIFDSVVWKEELEKKVIEFGDYLSGEFVLDDEVFDYKVEEFYFVTAYIVRKLVEAFKLSDEYCSVQYKLVKYLRNEDDYKIDYLNNYKIESHYNFKSSQNTSFSLDKICNLLIHSYMFMIAVENESLDGVFVTTDYDKEKFIFYLSLEEYMKLLCGCINDNIVREKYNRINVRLMLSSNYGEEEI